MIRRTLLTSLLGLALSVSSSCVCASMHNNTITPLQHKPSINKKDIDHFFSALYTTHRFYIKSVSYKELLDDAIEGMLTKLDPHSEYLNEDALSALHTNVSDHYVGIGVELTSINNMLTIAVTLDGSPAKKAGLKADDMIIKVNNTLLNDLSISNAIKLIKGKKNSFVTLTVLRKGEKKALTFKIKRKIVHYNSVSVTEPITGYPVVHIAIFQENLREKVKTAVSAIKNKHSISGLVLDLRNNPGGLLNEANALVGIFLTEQELKKFHGESVSIRGRYPQANDHFIATGSDFFKNIPMVILIDHGSASAAEIVAGALQDYKRAIVVGQTSFGKGSVQTVLPLNKNSAVKLTTSLYYTPAGREIQAEGIQPDISIPKLSVNTQTDDELDSINESNFKNHLLGHKAKSKNKKANAELATHDYNLYQALIILKSMTILSH